MVPVIGAGKRKVAKKNMARNVMRGGCVDGRMRVCRFPAEVALPENNTGLNSGLCPLDETPWAEMGWGYMRRQQIAPSPFERSSLIYKYRS